MFLDELTYDQLNKLYYYIGNGTRPITPAKALFPDKPKGYVRATRDIHHYCINKIVAINLAKDGEKEKSGMYIRIASDIWCQLPAYAKVISTDLINRI